MHVCWHSDQNTDVSPKVCQGWQKRELIRLVTDLQWTESYPLYLIVFFRRKQSNHPDFVAIAPILHDEANMT